MIMITNRRAKMKTLLGLLVNQLQVLCSQRPSLETRPESDISLKHNRRSTIKCMILKRVVTGEQTKN